MEKRNDQLNVEGLCKYGTQTYKQTQTHTHTLVYATIIEAIVF